MRSGRLQAAPERSEVLRHGRVKFKFSARQLEHQALGVQHLPLGAKRLSQAAGEAVAEEFQEQSFVRSVKLISADGMSDCCGVNADLMHPACGRHGVHKGLAAAALKGNEAGPGRIAVRARLLFEVYAGTGRTAYGQFAAGFQKKLTLQNGQIPLADKAILNGTLQGTGKIPAPDENDNAAGLPVEPGGHVQDVGPEPFAGGADKA